VKGGKSYFYLDIFSKNSDFALSNNIEFGARKG